jgi:thioredoxin 1
MSIIHIRSAEEYYNYINNKACVVKFTASRCGPCKRIAPVFEELSKNDSLSFVEVDIDISSFDEVIKKEGLEGVPLFLFYNKGAKLEELSMYGTDGDKLRFNVQSLTEHIEPNTKFLYLSEDNIAESDDGETEVGIETGEVEGDQVNGDVIETGEDLDVTEENDNKEDVTKSGEDVNVIESSE